MDQKMQFEEIKKTLGLKQENCETMSELRVEIDTLDEMVVEMLALRKTYMDQAARIKQDRNQVRDDERVIDVIKKVSKHADKVGADPELISNLYRSMIEWSINYEFDRFDDIKENEGSAA